jgi:hypothetical protein
VSRKRSNQLSYAPICYIKQFIRAGATWKDVAQPTGKLVNRYLGTPSNHPENGDEWRRAATSENSLESNQPPLATRRRTYVQRIELPDNRLELPADPFLSPVLGFTPEPESGFQCDGECFVFLDCQRKSCDI